MTDRIPECPFDEAFLWALSYDGYDDELNGIIEYIESNIDEYVDNGDYKHVVFPRQDMGFLTQKDVERDEPNSILWMILVQMFGDYGSSPRYGWIKHPHECVEYLKELRFRAYGPYKYDKAWWCDDKEKFDAYCSERARKQYWKEES